MAITYVTAEDVIFSRNDKPFLCINTITLNLTKAEISAACAGTGDWEAPLGGKKGFSFEFDAAMRLFTGTDATDNFSFNQAFDEWDNNTLADLEFKIGDATNGGSLYTGQGTLFDLSSSKDEDGKVTWSGTYRGFGKLTRTTIPTT